KAQQIPLDLEGLTAFGLEDYLIGPCNKDAVGWIERWPDWPAPVLIISGEAASGKTHLAAVWREISDAEIIKPEMLISKTAEQIAHIGKNLVFDGIDPWLGEDSAEVTLFHLYNIFKEEGRSFLITTRIAPSHVDFVIADLASRLRAAPVATIHSPDDILLGSVMIKLFSDRQLTVSNDVIKYILPRMERSFIAARDIVAKADRFALAQKRSISVPLMRQVLVDMQE
ncbi:MAG: DNA replication protein, partial [Alphaproteobacteria bacterium]|nr:DNA replication protein [Alphaproteobacteria bacterium]